MINYAKNRFLYGKDIDKFSDPFKFYKHGEPVPYMPSGYGGSHQQTMQSYEGGLGEDQMWHLPDEEGIINQDYKFVIKKDI